MNAEFKLGGRGLGCYASGHGEQIPVGISEPVVPELTRELLVGPVCLPRLGSNRARRQRRPCGKRVHRPSRARRATDNSATSVPPGTDILPTSMMEGRWCTPKHMGVWFIKC